MATLGSDGPPLKVFASKSPVAIEVINAHFAVGRTDNPVFLRVYRPAGCWDIRRVRFVW